MLLSGLFDVALACAPIVAAAPAVAAIATGHTVFGSRGLLQRRLYRSLLIAEKLNPTVPGSRQIIAGVERDTMALAYLTQYPQRGKDIAHIALIGLGLLAAVVAYYSLPGGLVSRLVLLAVVVFAAAWLDRAVRNFVRNDTVTRELFIHFGAPAELIRPRTDLITRTPRRTVATILGRAADVRDASAAPLSTVAAVNIVLAAGEVPWQAHVRTAAERVSGIDYRQRAKAASAQALTYSSRGYDWLLSRVADPLFLLRLTLLEMRERDRISQAHKVGDVYKAAWLTTHYRNERRRVDRQRSWLHTAHEQNVRSRRPLHSERDRTGFVG
ncbi:hypothetical protein [Mycolicibacterium sp.]|uniref:hypothetical protein n=1 Tax=Mycolicibacterium sp. TaxID=2320850 RepID=UPI0037CB4238